MGNNWLMLLSSEWITQVKESTLDNCWRTVVTRTIDDLAKAWSEYQDKYNACKELMHYLYLFYLGTLVIGSMVTER